MRSSSYLEEVTTPGDTLVGVDLVERAAEVGVQVPGGTYSGSHSSSEPIISWFDGATDLECPRD